MAQDTSYIRQFFEGIRDERGTHQNTATRIGTAFLLLLDYLASIDYPYLRKDIDDTAEGRITFLKGITAHLESLFEGLTFQDILKSEGASDGSDGTGIYMDAAAGTITTDGLSVRGWMSVAKLVYNMIQVMEQDYQFSGGGDIERVVANVDGTYTLHIHKEKDDRHTSFGDFDILYGKVDELQQSGQYYTSWMRVCENGVTLNEGMTPDTVRVELWQDSQVPGGRNFAPKDMMTVARRGNTQDSSRQSYWELSTTDERITYYWRVDQPVLRADNYALCLGILPTILDTAGVLPSTRDKEMPSLYVNTIFYENAHHIYYPSRVVKEDRGEWTATPMVTYTGVSGSYQGTDYVHGQPISEPYHHESFSRNIWLTYRLSPSNQSLSDAELLSKMREEWHVDLETSRVWRYGALWECLVDCTTQEPDLGCSDWSLIQQPPIVLQISSTKRLLRSSDWLPAGKVATTLSFVLLFGGYDMTGEVLQHEAVWTRQSVGSDADATLRAADSAWNQQHRYGDLTLPVTSGDLPSNWNTAREVQFTLTVTKNGGVAASRRLTLH